MSFKVSERADRRRHRAFSGEVENLGQELQVGRARQPSRDAGDDLEQILTKLTNDVERFDSMVVLHRKVLEDRNGAGGARDDAELSRRAERISLEAAHMVTDARQALEQLRRLGEPARPLSLNGSHRNRARGLTKDRSQG